MSGGMVNSFDAIYSIDKIEISTSLMIGSVHFYLPTSELKRECRQLVVIPIVTTSEIQRYNSKIIATVPSIGFFKLLASYNLRKHSISYIEITKDVGMDSEHEATVESYRLMSIGIEK